MHNKNFYKIFFISLSLTAQIFICGCGGVSKEKPLNAQAGIALSLDYGEIRGFVYRQSDKTPITAAIIETSDFQAKTASDASYILGPMPEGDYKVFARASGCGLCVKENIRVIKGQITPNVNFYMPEQEALFSKDFEIVGISPNIGTDGDEVSIFCRGCGKKAGRVLFNGIEAETISWNSSNDDKIVVYAPSKVESGPVKVIINGSASNEKTELYFYAKPVITSVSKSIASPTQVITVYGRNFSTVATQNSVTLNKQYCSVESVKNSSEMQIRLPANAETGILNISVNNTQYNLEGISNQIITIAPKIISLSPQRAVEGVYLTIKGLNFGTDPQSVKIKLGDKTIRRFETFSNKTIVIKSPGPDILKPGSSARLSVVVNEAESNALKFTSYNTLWATLKRGSYGIYNFNAVSNGGVLRLSCLAPTDKIAFLSILSGTAEQNFSGDYDYIVSGCMGAIKNSAGNSQINLPPQQRQSKRPNTALTNALRPALKASISKTPEENILLYFRNPYSDDYTNSEKDIIATATLKASSKHALVYAASNEAFLTNLSEAEANAAAKQFDDIYTRVSSVCANGISSPPEGNVDEQSKIALVFSSILNSFNPDDKENPLICRIDERDKDSTAPHSALTEAIYVNSEYYKTAPQETMSCIAQSLASMIYKNQKGAYASDIIDTGLSMLAAQEAGLGFMQANKRALSCVSAYLAKPQAYSLSYVDKPPLKGQYGLLYLFMQYLYDQYGGRAIIKTLETPSLSEGLSDIALRIVSDTTLEELFVNFCMAVYCSGLGLEDGFTGYNKALHGFKTINTNGFASGIRGIAPYITCGEKELTETVVSTKGFSCSVIDYPRGNWGDLEFKISDTPTVGSFSTWVIYYSTERPITP